MKLIVTEHKLVDSYRHRIRFIQREIGISDEHWSILYEPLFYNIAGLFQEIPKTTDVANTYDNLLEYSIDVALTSLKMQRSSLVGSAQNLEDQAKVNDLWKYATVISSLLYSSQRSMSAVSIEVYDRGRNRIVRWHPSMGKITGIKKGKYYIILNQESKEVHHPLLFLSHAIPSQGVEWLLTNTEIFNTIINVLSVRNDSELEGVIRRASEYCMGHIEPPHQLIGSHVSMERADDIHKPYMESTRPAAPLPSMLVERKTNAKVSVMKRAISVPSPIIETCGQGERFIAWLKTGIKNGSIKINGGKAQLQIVSDGLLLVTPAIFKSFDDVNWKRVQADLKRMKLVKKSSPNGETIFKYNIISDGTVKKTVNGFIFEEYSSFSRICLFLGSIRV